MNIEVQAKPFCTENKYFSLHLFSYHLIQTDAHLNWIITIQVKIKISKYLFLTDFILLSHEAYSTCL